MPKDGLEARRIMQDARGSKQGEVNRNLPPITKEAEYGEKESEIPEKGDSNLEDLDLVQNHPATINDQGVGGWVGGGRKTRFRKNRN